VSERENMNNWFQTDSGQSFPMWASSRVRPGPAI